MAPPKKTSMQSCFFPTSLWGCCFLRLHPAGSAVVRPAALSQLLISHTTHLAHSFHLTCRVLTCCVAGALHRASWRSCGVRGRCVGAAVCSLAGALHRAWISVASAAVSRTAGCARRTAPGGRVGRRHLSSRTAEGVESVDARHRCKHLQEPVGRRRDEVSKSFSTTLWAKLAK